MKTNKNNNPSPNIKNALSNKVGKTHVLFVLDQSSSMLSIKPQIVDALNNQIEKILEWDKAIKDNTYISFTVFADTPQVKFQNKSISSLVKIENKDYNPSGMTALNAGIGEALDSLEKEVDFNNKEDAFLVIILTDGGENHSTGKWASTSAIKERIMALTNQGNFTFSYIGVEDLKQVEYNYGIWASNSTNFVPDSDGTQRMSTLYSAAISSYGNLRSEGVTRSVNLIKES